MILWIRRVNCRSDAKPKPIVPQPHFAERPSSMKHPPLNPRNEKHKHERHKTREDFFLGAHKNVNNLKLDKTSF